MMLSPLPRSWRRAAGPSLVAALMPLGVALSGCSGGVGDAASTSSADALSSAPTFSFEPLGEGTSGDPSDADLRNAYWLAYASFELYAAGGEAQVKDDLHRLPGLHPVAFQWFTDAATDSAALYLRTPEVAILAYKGTDPNDWKQRFLLVDLPLESTTVGKAHQGFVDGFNDLWGSIRPYLLQDYAGSNVPLYVTGHSLGGAYATLAASALLHDDAFSDGDGGSRLAATYTFGSPRVGDADFSDDLTTQLEAKAVGFYRMVNDEDAIPGVLPSWPYSHPGRKVSGVTDITNASLIVHEEQELVWLDPSGTAYYGADGESRLESRWDDVAPTTTEMGACHQAYPTVLAAHR